MSTMVTEVYDAFREAGVSEQASRKVASAMGMATDDRFTKVEARLDSVARHLARVESRIEMVLWMQGVVLGLLLLALGSVFATLWRLVP